MDWITKEVEALFVLVREGPSDDGLIPHLRSLLIRAGVDEVVGSARDYKGTVAERILQVIAEESPVDLIFVHRDSDGPNGDARRHEIQTAVNSIEDVGAVIVPVVPIQELEAWLLLDESSIRQAAGRPSDRTPLGLPKLRNVENTSSPKEVLKAALLVASGAKGRRLREEQRRFSSRRRILLERLDIDGPIKGLSAWGDLLHDVQDAVAALQARVR